MFCTYKATFSRLSQNSLVVPQPTKKRMSVNNKSAPNGDVIGGPNETIEKLRHTYGIGSCSSMESNEADDSDGDNGVSKIGADSKSYSHAECQRLTPERRTIITSTFERMKVNGVNNILMVFIRMFSEHPHYKNIWSQFKGIPDSSLISSDALRNHATVYLGGMSYVINLMNESKETEMRTLIRKMAASHAKYGIHKYHLMNMLPEFISVLGYVGIPLTDEVKDAWTTLFDVIGNLLSKPPAKN